MQFPVDRRLLSPQRFDIDPMLANKRFLDNVEAHTHHSIEPNIHHKVYRLTKREAGVSQCFGRGNHREVAPMACD